MGLTHAVRDVHGWDQGPLVDLQPWGDLLVVATQKGGVLGRDVRAKHDVWHLPCNPATVGPDAPLSPLSRAEQLMPAGPRRLWVQRQDVAAGLSGSRRSQLADKALLARLCATCAPWHPVCQAPWLQG